MRINYTLSCISNDNYVASEEYFVRLSHCEKGNDEQASFWRNSMEGKKISNQGYFLMFLRRSLIQHKIDRVRYVTGFLVKHAVHFFFTPGLRRVHKEQVHSPFFTSCSIVAFWSRVFSRDKAVQCL